MFSLGFHTKTRLYNNTKKINMNYRQNLIFKIVAYLFCAFLLCQAKNIKQI